MYEKALLKILEGVTVGCPAWPADATLAEVMTDPEKYGYVRGWDCDVESVTICQFCAVVDAVENMVEEGRSIDRLSPDFDSSSLLTHGERPNPEA